MSVYLRNTANVFKMTSLCRGTPNYVNFLASIVWLSIMEHVTVIGVGPWKAGVGTGPEGF